MIYKIYEGLSDYLIAPDGTAINKTNNEVIPFQRTPLVAGFTAKLITDETFTFIKGKRKPIKLVRRFTREELVKMYGRSKNMFNDLGSEIPYTEKAKGISLDAYKDQPEAKGMSGFEQAIAEASMDKGEVIPLKQIEAEYMKEASTFTQEQLDQLAASKRTVKSHPKAKPSVQKKVAKAIEAVKPKVVTRGGKKQVTILEEDAASITTRTTPVTMKIPFLKIDGVDYQSARQASKALGVAVNTVLKRAKANKDGWFYIEK